MPFPAHADRSLNEQAPVRVMLVDDSAVVRGLLRKFIDPVEDIEVVTTVANGEVAVATLKRNPVDIIVLDIEMPVMDGLTAIPLLLEAQPGVKIIMASALTTRNADISLKALKAGASDYVPKPGSGLGNAEEFRRELIEKICTLGRAGARRARPRVAPSPAIAPIRPSPTAVPTPIRKRILSAAPKVVAIGSSTGGPEALTRVLKDIDPAMKLPILITQHMPATFTTILADHLTRDTGREVIEAQAGMTVSAGKAYLAPGDYHMLVEGEPPNPTIKLTQSEKVNFCRPAVDVMMNSIVACYGAGVLAVILTGMGNDGLKGCEAVAEANGTIVAQNEETSVVWGMPGAVTKAGLCDEVLDIAEMGKTISRLTKAIL